MILKHKDKFICTCGIVLDKPHCRYCNSYEEKLKNNVEFIEICKDFDIVLANMFKILKENMGNSANG